MKAKKKKKRFVTYSKFVFFSDGVDERQTLTPSLQREKRPLYFTGVVTSPHQIHNTPEKEARKSTDMSYLFVPQTEIQSMVFYNCFHFKMKWTRELEQ